jgi:hypothetical protein
MRAGGMVFHTYRNAKARNLPETAPGGRRKKA